MCSPGFSGALLGAQFLGLRAVLGAQPAGSQQPAQGGEPGWSGGSGVAGLNPRVESAVHGLVVVAAAAFAGLGARLKVGEGTEDPVRVNMGQPEGADAGRVDDPAARRRVLHLERQCGGRGMPAAAGNGVHSAGGAP